MKTSIITVIVLFVALATQAQQTDPNQEGSLTYLNEYNNSERIVEPANTVPIINNIIQNEVAAMSVYLMKHFDQVKLNSQCSVSANELTEGKLMTSIRETFSYSRKMMFNNKKYEIISGMTGKGVGVKLRL